MSVCTVIHVFVLLTYATSAKSLTRPAAVCSHNSLSPIFYYMRLQWREGEVGPGSPPKVRDETPWQAQVMGLNTFGAFESHRHPVVIHQHMCWNVSPSLNIVSVGVRLMHGCFSLVHAEGHCWLALQRLTHIRSHVSLDAIHTHQPAAWKEDANVAAAFGKQELVSVLGFVQCFCWQYGGYTQQVGLPLK